MKKGLQFCMETSDAVPSVCYNAYNVLSIGFLRVHIILDSFVSKQEAAKIMKPGNISCL